MSEFNCDMGEKIDNELNIKVLQHVTFLKKMGYKCFSEDRWKEKIKLLSRHYLLVALVSLIFGIAMGYELSFII